MSATRMTTIWCDGLDGTGTRHAPGCEMWSGEGDDALAARRASNFVRRPGGKDYSPECITAREATCAAPKDGAR